MIPSEPTTDSRRVRSRPQIASWLRETIVRDVIIATIIGVLVGTTSGCISGTVIADRQEATDDRRAVQYLRLENLRFVRDRSSVTAIERPFIALDLEGMNLSSLKLDDATFEKANLSKTQLDEIHLKDALMDHVSLDDAYGRDVSFDGAELNSATLTDAAFLGGSFAGAKLRSTSAAGAVFIDIDFADADFERADLRGADLHRSDLQGAFLAGSCHDDSTLWPTGFIPPRSAEVDSCGPVVDLQIIPKDRRVVG